jgi:hypothetical protein
MSKLIDFDAFRAEQAAEPVRLLIGGVEYELAPALPASLALDVVRMQSELGAGAELRPEQIEPIARGLFGDELFATLMAEHRLTIDELPTLVRLAFEAYNAGAVPAPNRVTRRASSKRRSRS